jgi:thioredoxin-like negative regulator of GroEL
MNGLLFLSSDDFYISDDQNEKLLSSHCNQDLLLVLFYSTQCAHCQKALPVFRQLPQVVHGCTFGMINVSTNARVVHMSRSTILPIQYVPLVILYVNGQPFYKYKGALTVPDIQKFIVQMSQMLESKQQFVKPPEKPGKRIPEFSIGIPYCDEDVCYLDFDEAYEA